MLNNNECVDVPKNGFADVNQLVHALDSGDVLFEPIENDLFIDEACQILYSRACSQDNLVGKEHERDSGTIYFNFTKIR